MRACSKHHADALLLQVGEGSSVLVNMAGKVADMGAVIRISIQKFESKIMDYSSGI
jgi:hypothetical protein